MLGTYFIMVYKKYWNGNTYPRSFWIHQYIHWIISLLMLGTYLIIMVYKKYWNGNTYPRLFWIHQYIHWIISYFLVNAYHQYPKIWDIWNTKMAKNSTTKMWHLWSQLFSKAWNNWFVEHKKVSCKSKCKKLHLYEIIVVSFMNLNQTNYIIVSLLKLGTYLSCSIKRYIL